jgi:hypothetical protein
VSLAGVQITEFASSPVVFGSGVNLAAGARIIVARNPAVFESVYGPGYNVLPAGYGADNLSNGGERIVLGGPLGETLQDFTYDDAAPWPTSPDGGGPTLEIVNALGDPDDPANWRASWYVNGSPGASGVPGDYDGNGVVEQADYGVWRSKFGLPVAVGTSADGNRDGMVDAADYIVWRKAMTPPGSGAAIAASVATAVSAADEKGDGSLFAFPAVTRRATLGTQKDTRPLFLAVDEFFSRFDSARPPFRPAFTRTGAAGAGDDDLLLASLTSRADRAAVGATQEVVDDRCGDDEPVDTLLADWAGVDDGLDF